ncbi:MAG: IS3 family transposase [Faecalimonas umbilicata]
MKLGKLRHESKYLAIRYFYTKKNWSIEWMCRQLEISRAAYYKWLHREVPYEELENIRLAELVKEYDERFCHILGYRRMTSWINHFNHTSYSKNRVHRIMKKLGIHSVIRKKKKNIFMPSRMKRQKIYFKGISMLLFPIKNGLQM